MTFSAAGTCYWDGTGPFCKGKCPEGYTECGRDNNGDGDFHEDDYNDNDDKCVYNDNDDDDECDGDDDNTIKTRLHLLDWTQGMLLQSLEKYYNGLVITLAIAITITKAMTITKVLAMRFDAESEYKVLF